MGIRRTELQRRTRRSHPQQAPSQMGPRDPSTLRTKRRTQRAMPRMPRNLRLETRSRRKHQETLPHLQQTPGHLHQLQNHLGRQSINGQPRTHHQPRRPHQRDTSTHIANRIKICYSSECPGEVSDFPRATQKPRPFWSGGFLFKPGPTGYANHKGRAQNLQPEKTLG